MKSFLFKGRFVIAIIAALVIVGAVLFGIGVFGRENNVIAKGVSVSGIDLGGMTKAEAKSAIDDYADFAEDVVLSFECEGTSFTVPASQIALAADSEATVSRAYAIGRGEDKAKNKEDIKKAKNDGLRLSLALTYDKDKFLLSAGDYLGSKIVDPSPMTVEIGEDCLVITNARAGKTVSIDKATEAMEKELSDLKADEPIVLFLEDYTPENLTFEQFKEQYVHEAKDAVYTNEDGNHHIEPEVVGVEIDEVEAKRIFEKNKTSAEPYEIPAKITHPDVTAKYLEDKYVNKIMAKYSTSFAGSSQGRCTNIALAASKIDGYVVNPGGRFSYNEVVGPRTEAAGFKSAHVYVGTKVVDGIGGGICQVSSTLYNAVVMADLKTVTRVNHSIPVSYVPLGRDATVSYGTIDYVFENNKPYPVSIKAKTEGTTLTISIVGTSEMDYTVEFQTRYVSSIPYSTVRNDDEALPEGESKITTPGSNGSVYESYRVYKKDGVEYDRKFESRSRYQPVAQEVSVGTKKADEPSEEITPAPEETPQDTPNEDALQQDSVQPNPPADEVTDSPVPEPEIPGDLEDIIVHPEPEGEIGVQQDETAE